MTMWRSAAVCALPVMEPLRAGPTAAAGHSLSTPVLPSTLTSAERSVAAAVLRGCSHAEIARERGSSPRTVANQLAGAFRKLQVRSRAELAASLAAHNRTLLRVLPGGRQARLSDRERQAARLAALGHGNKHIAYELGVGLSTVSTYLERASTKLGAGSRVSLIQIMSSLPIETE
jgi:DNA-binding NarL/FixJ family response regulator